MTQLFSFWLIKNFKRNVTVKILVSALLFSALQVVSVSVSPVASAATGDAGSVQFDEPRTNYLKMDTVNSAFGFGTADFTIEFWWKPTTSRRSDTLDFYNLASANMPRLDIGANIGTGAIELYTDSGCSIGSGVTLSSVLNKWTHIALTKASGSLFFWVNGVQKGTIACNKDFGLAGYSLTIMKDHGAGANGSGSLSNIRVVKGAALYTSTFAPPTSQLNNVAGTSFLMNTVQGVDFLKDSSANNLTVTSVNTPLSSASAPAPAGSISTFTDDKVSPIYGTFTNVPGATQAYTVETWFYTTTQTNSNGQPQWIFAGEQDGCSNGLEVFINGGIIQIATNGANYSSNYNSAEVSINTWHHLAIGADASGKTSIYLDGTNIIKNGWFQPRAWIEKTWSLGGRLSCGSSPGSISGLGYPLRGGVSDFRYVLGTQIYTSNFTPSQTPMIVVPGTQLLLRTAYSSTNDQTIMLADSSGNSTALSTVYGVSTITSSKMTPFIVTTNTTLATTSASSIYGATNTFTATVDASTATGTVGFQNNGVSISDCGSVVVTARVATCTTWKPAVGTYSNITATYSGNSNFKSSTSTPISLSVTPAPLSITASSPAVNYGATIPTISATYSGLVNSDISSVVTGQSCITAYTTTSAVGTSPSTSCSGGSASNYTISYVAGAVTINKATPTFSSFGNVPKTYGALNFDLTAPTPSTPGTWTYASGSPSIISLTGISATVAGYGTSVVTATFTPDDAANYVSGGTIAMTVTVSKATLGITASSHTVSFGAAIPTITPVYSGFVNGEGSSVLSNLVCATSYTTTTSVGTTGSSCSRAEASNYSFVYTAGVITVTQGGQTSALTISSTSVTYGSTLSLTTGGGTGSGSNSFVVDSGPCTVSGSTLSTTAAGTCMVTATKAANGNYLVSSSTSTAITVNPKGLSITGLTGVNKEFDHGVVGTATGTPTLVGKVGSDDVLLSGTPTFAFGAAAVTNGHTLTASGYTLTGTTAGNYTLTQPTVTANITAKAARVAATNTTVAYGAAVTSGFTTSALISPDAVGSASYTYTGTGTSTPPTAVGVYTVTPSNAVFSTGSIGNYTISYDTATVTILAKYTITYNANGGVIGSNSTTSDDFVVGDTALALPTPTREGFNFLGWFTLESNGVQVSGAYTPSATATLWAHWIQKSLVGVGNSRKIGAITTLADVGNTYSATSTNGTVAVTYVANALPVGTIIDIYQMSDSSRASSIISSTNNYVLSLVIAWLTPTNTVPLLSAADALTMVITDSAIKKGAKVYSLIGSDSTLLGTATADGSVTVRILEDPEVYIAITKPDAPTGVSATSGGNASTTVSWTAPSDGGSAITGYTATSNAGQTCSSTTTTTCSVTGLTNGTSYTFTVTATNTIGTSEPSSASSSATPAAPVVVTPAPSSGGGGAGGGSTYVEPTPTVDPAVAAAALAVQKALAEKAAAEAKVVAAAKAAAEAKVLADKKAADEAELAAIIKALQEQGALEAAAKKVADELVASQLKAEEDLKIATALELAEEQRIAAEKAVALAASKKITTVYSTTAAFKLNKTYTNRLSLYTKKIAAGSTVTCIGYAKSTKTLSYTTAKVVATKQAKALCSSMKKINPTLKTKSVVYPASKAPVTTVNKKWIPVSYRIVSPVN